MKLYSTAFVTITLMVFSALCSGGAVANPTVTTIEFSKTIQTENECMIVFSEIPEASRICFGQDDQIDYYRKVLGQKPWDKREMQVAYADINLDGQNEIIVRSLHVLDCGTAGCINGVYYRGSGKDEPDIPGWKYSRIGTSLAQMKLIVHASTATPQLFFEGSTFRYDVDVILKNGRALSKI